MGEGRGDYCQNIRNAHLNSGGKTIVMAITDVVLKLEGGGAGDHRQDCIRNTTETRRRRRTSSSENYPMYSWNWIEGAVGMGKNMRWTSDGVQKLRAVDRF